MIPDAHRAKPERATYTGHDPAYGPNGTDVRIEFWEDGSMTFALRPGRDATEVTWGPPYDLHDASELRPIGGRTSRVAGWSE